MGEVIMTLIIALVMLFIVYLIVTAILSKNAKELNVKFGLTGFNVSGKFYKQ